MRISDWSSDVCSSDLIRVTASYTRGLEPVTGDRVQLQQVIVNLLINEFQAVESQEVANRKILLATGIEEDNSVYFSLRDSGSGIPAEHLAQLFHVFLTTKENRTEEFHVGKECDSHWSSLWSRDHKKNKK